MSSSLGSNITAYLYKLAEPINFFTLALVIVGMLQWRTLDKTDQTLRLQQRAWIEFVGASLVAQPK
jgi:hypothetical protein